MPLTYTASGLPTGLTIDPASGVISGTPSAAGNFGVTITVFDGHSSARTSFAWRIVNDQGPVVTNPGGQRNYAGDVVTLQIVAKDNDSDRLRYSAVGLPSGLQIDSATGLISGTISQLNARDSDVRFAVTVTVTDRYFAASVTFNWDVLHPPTIIQPRDQVNASGNSVTLQIVHGTGTQAGVAEPGVFSATGLPPGLTISADGLIAGTLPASATGAWDPTVRSM